MIQTIDTILAAVSRLCMFLASAALVILIVAFGWLVFGRYVLNATPTWVEQLALLLICYIAFLGAAAGVRSNTHLGVTVFRDMLPVTAQKVLMIAIDLILAAFGLVMLLAGMELMQFGWNTMLPMLDIPESFRTLAITSCGGLVCLFAAFRALSRALHFNDGDWHNPLEAEL